MSRAAPGESRPRRKQGLGSTPSMPARPDERSSPGRAAVRRRLGSATAPRCGNSRAGIPARRVPLTKVLASSRDGAKRRIGHDAGDGSSDELRSRSSTAQEGVGGEPSLEGHQARLHGGGRRPAARLDPHRAHARAPRRGEALEARQRGALRQLARRDDRQPGDAAGQGRPEGDLPVRLAGRRRREHRGRDVSGPVALSGQLGAERRQADQQHVRARRPDPAHGRQRQRSTSSRRSSPTPRPASAAC